MYKIPHTIVIFLFHISLNCFARIWMLLQLIGSDSDKKGRETLRLATLWCVDITWVWCRRLILRGSGVDG